MRIYLKRDLVKPSGVLAMQRDVSLSQLICQLLRREIHAATRRGEIKPAA